MLKEFEIVKALQDNEEKLGKFRELFKLATLKTTQDLIQHNALELKKKLEIDKGIENITKGGTEPTEGLNTYKINALDVEVFSNMSIEAPNEAEARKAFTQRVSSFLVVAKIDRIK